MNRLPSTCLATFCTLTLLFAAFFAVGCEKKGSDDQVNTIQTPATAPSDPAGPVAKPALGTPLDCYTVEAIGQALANWRSLSAQKPALLFFAADPQLKPIPKQSEPLAELLRKIPAAQLLDRTSPAAPNPFFLPDMALRAAAESGLFSGIRWVIPATPAQEEISLESFRQEMTAQGYLAPEEAASFRRQNDRFIGTVSGIPLEALYIDRLDATPGPAVIHLDLTFFRPLYRGDVTTPLYDLVLSVLESIRLVQQPTLMATVSIGNISGEIPLEMRFLGGQIQQIFRDPSLLEKRPSSWHLYQDGIMLENLLSFDKMHAVYSRIMETIPEDPAGWFGLYRSYRNLKKGQEALDALGEAVKKDPIYALEYLKLAGMAAQRNRPTEATRMLRLAAQALPQNPFLRIKLAANLTENDQKDEARVLLQELATEPWSLLYYPGIPSQIDRLSNQK